MHGVEVGDAHQVRTQIPATARAMLSMRLAPGQDSATVWPVLQRLLTAAAPDGADVRVTLNNACEPARAEPGHPVTRIGIAALERAAGVAPVLVPAGGSLPVLARLRGARHPGGADRLRHARLARPRATSRSASTASSWRSARRASSTAAWGRTADRPWSAADRCRTVAVRLPVPTRAASVRILSPSTRYPVGGE